MPERRRREDAELRQKEEQRRREVAEQRTRPTTLQDFLQRCHDLCTSINVVLDKSLTTQGEITTPTNRLYPKKILPWTDFTERQAEIWKEIGKASAFPIDHLFSSPSDFEYVHKQLRPVASDADASVSRCGRPDRPTIIYIDLAWHLSPLPRRPDIHYFMWTSCKHRLEAQCLVCTKILNAALRQDYDHEETSESVGSLSLYQR